MKKLLSVILALMLFGTSFVAVAESETAYNCSDWAVESVEMVHALGFTNPERTYSYTAPITREEFCELIYNLVSETDYFENWLYTQTKGYTVPLPPFAKRPFDDTSNSMIYTLYNHNIVYGKSETEFFPNDYLTREEAATILVRMINIVQPMPTTEKYYSYDDVEEISEWASYSVQTISNLEFMQGIGDNQFAPKDTYTAEQAMATILRVYNAFKNDSVLKFSDKNGNIILTEDDITSCTAKFDDISLTGIAQWYLELFLTEDGQERLKNATALICEYEENYITISFENSVISMPYVMEEIDSTASVITGTFTQESATEFANIINSAKE